jgi:hypothetical protein
MALLGTYGGADDVRILQNRILAEQAGALVPEGGGKTTYPKPVLTEIPTITITDDTVAGEFVLDVSSPGVIKTDKELYGVQVTWCVSQVGTTNSNNTELTTFGVDESIYTIKTSSFASLVRPCVIYAKVSHIIDGVDNFSYSDGKQIPALPVLRTASTRTTRKVTA